MHQLEFLRNLYLEYEYVLGRAATQVFSKEEEYLAKKIVGLNHQIYFKLETFLLPVETV